MPRIVDNLIAYRVLSMLVKPFVDTDAYKLGIIDTKGKNLIKPSQFTHEQQKDAYTYLHRLVFNMKKIINKTPGGENKLKSLVAALFLIKESYEKHEYTLTDLENKYIDILDSNAILAEETVLVEKFKKELDEDGAVGGGGVPANSTAGVAVDQPKVDANAMSKYKKKNAINSPIGFTRRAKPI
jgi:hypothetical protein